MIKRFSILFSSGLRRQIRMDAKVKGSAGMASAMDFIQCMLALHLGTMSAEDLATQMWTYVPTGREKPRLIEHFTPGYTSNDVLLRCFDRAHRMNAVIDILADRDISVYFRFFDPASQTPFAAYVAHFRISDGIYSGGGEDLNGKV